VEFFIFLWLLVIASLSHALESTQSRITFQEKDQMPLRFFDPGKSQNGLR